MEIINPKYKQRENEDKFEYGLRLITIKCEDNPQDLDWQDLVDILELGIHRDSLRKACNTTEFSGYNVMKYFKDNKLNSITDNELIKELEDKKRELDISRKKMQTINIEYNRTNRDKSKRELYYENIGVAIQQIPVPKLETIQIQERNEEYVMVFSDPHYNATFESITNSYSREICKDRFELLLSELKIYIEKNKISKLKIVNGGDSLQGMLRVGDLKLNDLSVIDSLVEFQKLLASFLNELSVFCNVEYYHVNSANHTELRLLGAKAREMSVEDMEKIIVNYLHDVLKDNPRIFINTEFKQDTTQFKVLDYNIIAIHGHQLKNMKTAIRDYSDKYDIPFDFCILGHYHSGMELCVGERKGYAKEVLVCPSFVGTCPYADTLMVGGKSAVKIHKFIEGKGRRNTESIVLN
jgi:16S rRNA G966 N2-methylase RsmD